MQQRLLVLSFALLTLECLAEPATIMYYNFFGEFMTEETYNIETDINEDSLFKIQDRLSLARKNNNNSDRIDSNLAIVGYGETGDATEFFAASSDINSQVPLKESLLNIPERKIGSQWYIVFVNSAYSPYVKNKKDVHFACPFRFLARVGLQNLEYFSRQN